MKKLLAAVTVLAVSTAQAATIHVDATNCPGPGDGSVGDPFCSIQTVIDNAVDTDEIVVAPGTVPSRPAANSKVDHSPAARGRNSRDNRCASAI